MLEHLLLESTRDMRHQEILNLLNRGTHYEWRSLKEERYWDKVTRKIIREHLRGNVTVLSESCMMFCAQRAELLSESPGQLNEILGSLKKGLSWLAKKLPGKRLKSRNWKIFGGGGGKEDAEYDAAHKEAMGNLAGNEKAIAVIGQKLATLEQDLYALPHGDNDSDRFPNNASFDVFQQGCAMLLAIAKSAKMAAEKKDPTLPVDVANMVIKSIRRLIMSYDRKLQDRWIYATESLRSPRLADVLFEDIKSGEKSTSAVSSQESLGNKGPAVLAALGLLGVTFGALTQTSWFADLFTDPAKYKIVFKTIFGKYGVTKHLAMLIGRPDANLGSMTQGEFMKQMAEKGLVDENGHPTEMLVTLAKEGGNLDFLKWWETNLEGKNPLATLGKLIPPNGAGAPGAGGDIISSEVVGKLRQNVLISAGGMSATGAWLTSILGPVAAGLGVGALAAAGVSKLLRSAGKEKSRSAVFKLLLDEIEDAVEVKDEDRVEEKPAAETAPGAAPGTAPGTAPGAAPGTAPGTPSSTSGAQQPAQKFQKVTGKDAMLAAYAYGLTRKRIEKKYNSVKNDLERQAANQGLKAGAKEKFVKEKLRDQNVVTPGSPEHKKLWQKELQRVFSTKDISISESLSLRGAFSHLFEFSGVTSASSKFMSKLGVSDDTSTSKSGLDPKAFADFEERMAARKEKEKSEQTSAEKVEKPSTPDAAAKPGASSGGPPSDGASGSGPAGGGGKESDAPKTRASRGAAHVYDKISADGRKFIVGSLFEIKKKSRAGAMSLASFLFETPDAPAATPAAPDAPAATPAAPDAPAATPAAPEKAKIDFEKLWTLVNTKENQVNKTPDQIIQKAQASYTSKGDVRGGKASDGLKEKGSDEPEGKKQQLLKKYEDISREIDKILKARKMFVNNGVEIKWSDIPKKDASALETQLKTYRGACNAYIDGSGDPKIISLIDPNAIKTLSQGWKFTPPPPEAPNEVQASSGHKGEVQAVKESFARQDRQLVERWQRLAGIKVI